MGVATWVLSVLSACWRYCGCCVGAEWVLGVFGMKVTHASTILSNLGASRRQPPERGRQLEGGREGGLGSSCAT